MMCTRFSNSNPQSSSFNHFLLAGIISFSAMGFDVNDEAAVEATNASALASSLMAALFPPVLAAFMSEDEEISGPLLPFLVAYVARLKALHKRWAGKYDARITM